MKQTLLTLIILIVALIIHLSIGTFFISPVDIISGLFQSGDPASQIILYQYRLPRAMVAIISGSGLAVAGMILQVLVRNPLASPDVIGVTKGASLFAVTILLVFPTAPFFLIPLSAIFGAILTMALLFLMTTRMRLSGTALALSGIGFSAFCTSLTELLTVQFPLDVNQALLWLSGSLWGRGYDEVYLGLTVLPFCFYALVKSRSLGVLQFDDDTTIGLGQPIIQSRLVWLTLSCVITGICVALVGSIGFIGLLAPHIAKKIGGGVHRHSLFLSIGIGAILMLTADGIGRAILPPLEIPVGLVTAIIGGPYFLWVLWRLRKRKIKS